jgi:hypothetical protein
VRVSVACFYVASPFVVSIFAEAIKAINFPRMCKLSDQRTGTTDADNQFISKERYCAFNFCVSAAVTSVMTQW